MRKTMMAALFALCAAPGLAQANGPLPQYLDHLAKVNPNLGRILHENPGVGKYLERMHQQGAVFQGAKPGQARTSVNWTIWNHSEATNGKYGHGMKDDTILNKDVVVVWQKGDGSTHVDVGGWGGKPAGQIIGVYQLRDQVKGGQRWADGGFNGSMNVEGAGTPGQKDVMAWGVIGIDATGRVTGGGLPDMRGGSPVPYQVLQAAGQHASGRQYEGRAAEVEHGKSNYVPLADGDSWAR
jgi:hypothetical protein